MSIAVDPPPLLLFNQTKMIPILRCLIMIGCLLIPTLAAAISYTPNGTTGLNLVVSGDIDDSFYPVVLPFPITFLNVSYSTIYVGTNGYITFTAGSPNYSGLSASNPPGPHLNIFPADRRLHKLYYAHLNVGTATEKFVIRQEGVDYTNPNNPNIWEVHFYPNSSYFDVFFVVTPGGNTTSVGVSDGVSFLTTVADTALTGQRISSDGTAGEGYVSGISGGQSVVRAAGYATVSGSSTNSIYIDQVGDNNAITVLQASPYNTVKGASGPYATIHGDSNTVTIRQGDAVDTTGRNVVQLDLNGNANTLALNQGRNTAGNADGQESGGHFQSINLSGLSNSLTTAQDNLGGSASGHFLNLAITGNYNTMNFRQLQNTAKTQFTTILGNSNTVSTIQTGTGAHFLDLSLTGNGHNVTTNQSGTGTHSATIGLTNAGGPATLNMTQQGSLNQTYSILQSCMNPAGCQTTITQGN